MNRDQPLVSVIVVSHNQGDFIREAIDSTLDQTYPNIEVIAVDDGSSDHTVEEIRKICTTEVPFKKLFLSGAGYCKAFNKGLATSRGKFIIDLSGDDILMPERVEQGVSSLLTSGAGIDFCDAYYIDEHSVISGSHYNRDDHNRLLDHVPDGYIFSELLERYFICTPTMMIDRQVLEALGGYDESLYYEDFDFWIRSSRYYRYHFTDRLMVKKRVHTKSMSKSQYLPDSRMLETTLQVCRKAFGLCQTSSELRSLGVRLRYELRQAVISNNYDVARELHRLLGEVHRDTLEFRIWAWLISKGWDFSLLSHFIRKAR